MKLFVDDKRDAPSNEYQVVRNFQFATTLLSVMNFEFIDLDYSLEEDKTGLDILKWMYENNISVPHINIHSSNIEGRKEMLIYAKNHFPDTTVTYFVAK
ncbi:MAG: cyclic-phosphate processing receiver domain-containing protein [Ruminococcus sp.]